MHTNYVIQDQLFESERVEEIKQEISSLKAQLESVVEERDDYMSLLGNMHKQLNDIAINESPRDIEQDIKNIAKKCAGSSKSFNKIIDNVKFDSSLPISIQNSIEKCLRRKLGVKPDDLNFYGLISIGKDSGLLNEEALDYLHTIRKQRNIFAHTEVGAQTRFSRISFVLNSAALLWSHLECGSK
jgi:sugar-specific transcriptional regulator TrmB